MKRYGKGGIIMSAVNTNYEYKPAYSVSATDKADKSKETSTVKLSTDAQKYLEQLKGKYKNVDFIVADFSSDEEAQKHLAFCRRPFPDSLHLCVAAALGQIGDVELLRHGFQEHRQREGFIIAFHRNYLLATSSFPVRCL